jgi:hypothetical protein
MIGRILRVLLSCIASKRNLEGEEVDGGRRGVSPAITGAL